MKTGNSSPRRRKEGAGLVPEPLLCAGALDARHEDGLFENIELLFTLLI